MFLLRYHGSQLIKKLKMNQLQNWRLAGVTATLVLGCILHFVYEWTGHSKITGFFVPVNESVWEHLKLGYWSVTLFSLVEYFYIRKHTSNYFLAKITGIVCLELTIIIVYYGYHFVSDKNVFFLDIFSYVIGSIVCEYIIYSIIILRPVSQQINRLSFLACISLGILFGLATYYPPTFSIFTDQNTNTRGIPES